MCLDLPLSLSLPRSLCLSVSLSLSIFLYLSLSLSLSLSVPFSLFPSQSLPLPSREVLGDLGSWLADWASRDAGSSWEGFLYEPLGITCTVSWATIRFETRIAAHRRVEATTTESKADYPELGTGDVSTSSTLCGVRKQE